MTQHDPRGTRGTTPLEPVDELLQEWHVRVRRANVAHLRATDRLSWRNFGLGGTATVLAAVVSSSVFGTLQEAVATELRVVVASVSLLSAGLIGLNTYLRYGERVEAHRRASRGYGSVDRDIDKLKAAQPAEPKLNERVTEIGRRLDEIDDQAPNVPIRVWRWAVNAVELEGTEGNKVLDASCVSHWSQKR